MLKFPLLALLVSCGVDTSEIITPVGPPEWYDEVSTAVATWQAALGDCKFPLTVGTGGMPVVLYDSDEWPDSKTAGGVYHYGVFGQGVHIHVRDHGALLHELGHAVGLAHDPDKTTVMYHVELVSVLTPKDVAQARAVLGCE